MHYFLKPKLDFTFYTAIWLAVHTFLMVNYPTFWAYSLGFAYFLLVFAFKFGCPAQNLKIKVEDSSLLPYYKAKEHQPTVYDGDVGLDLPCPSDLTIQPGEIKKIPLGIACEPYWKNGYYLFPRSSISKTSLIQVNSVGIIDPTYRGQLTGAVRNLGDEPYEIKAGDRLFQLCIHTLTAFKIRLVEKLSETKRGRGGFGSTG